MDKPRMTEGQLRRARKLIRRLCANYDEGNCLALDEGEGCVCVQSICRADGTKEGSLFWLPKGP